MQIVASFVASSCVVGLCWGMQRLARRVELSAPEYARRGLAGDLCAALFVLVAFSVAASTPWWWHTTHGWARFFAGALVAVVAIVAVSLVFGAVSRFVLEVRSRRYGLGETRSMRLERRVLAVASVLVVVAAIAATVQYDTPPPPQTQRDEDYIADLLFAADIGHELSKLDLRGDPELETVSRALRLGASVDSEARRLAERWNLPDRTVWARQRENLATVVDAYRAALPTDPTAAHRGLRTYIVGIASGSEIGCGLAQFFLSTGVARLADADEERCIEAVHAVDAVATLLFEDLDDG